MKIKPAHQLTYLSALMTMAGSLILVSVDSRMGQALALGLIFPGGGFMLGGNWILASASLLTFMLGFATARNQTKAITAIAISLLSALWAMEHAATSGTCQLLWLFGVPYAYRYWPMAMEVIPLVGVVALCVNYMISRLESTSRKPGLWEE